MTRLLATASVIALLAAPAWAGGSQDHTCQGGHNCNSGGGMPSSATSSSAASADAHAAAIAAQQQAQIQAQRQSQSSVNRNTNTAYGGQGGAGGNANATGGSAKSSVANSGNNTFNINTTSQYVDPPAATAPASAAADPASDPSSGHHSHGGGGGYHGGSSTQVIAPPSPGVALAPAAGAFCPGMGIGAGGSGLTGAGVFTYTWEAPNCTAMQYAQILNAMGHPDAALYVMEQKSDLVRNALKWEADRHEAPVPAPQEPFIDGFCRDNPSLCD